MWVIVSVMTTPSHLTVPEPAISQIGVGLSPTEKAERGRHQADGAILYALAEAVSRPALQDILIATISDPTLADEFAKRVTPYPNARRAPARRRALADILRTAADAIADEALFVKGPIEPPTVALTRRQKALAKMAFANMATRAVLAGEEIWESERLVAFVAAEAAHGERRNQARTDVGTGLPVALEGAQMVVRLFLGDCIRVDCKTAQPPWAASGRTPFYCDACRKDKAEQKRATHQRRMYDSLDGLVALLDAAGVWAATGPGVLAPA